MSHVPGPGRPSKLTRKLRDEVVRCIELGCNYKTTCSYVGISYPTFKRWMISGRTQDPVNKKYRSFRAAVKRAKATLELNCLQRINLAGMEAKHWQACAWILQHVVQGKYLKTAQAIYKPELNVTLSDVARELDDEKDLGSFHENGNGHFRG